MEQIYLVMLVVLGILAITDLVVGVSNDAVNFLNSAIGSKAVSFRTIMIVASLGVLVGALFSSGMMEIARSGIFVPAMFSFNDVMIIFLSVMIADIILLDFYNSFGMPTSTTVSIIFELLGAAFCLALYKIYMSDGDLNTIGDYINTEKATQIVTSILLSVVLSFTLGSVVQYISRLIFTFQYEKRMKYIGAIFGGLAITAITFFILIKGLKGVSFISSDTHYWIKENQWMIIAGNFVFFTALSQVLMTFFKVNILRVIIIIGTFALALAFAGNDLVNFIGVPIAAFNSYQIFSGSGVSGDVFMMGALADENIVAPFYFLVFAGLVMVVTIWTSKKAKSVIETEVNLSRQDEGSERFSSNALSKSVVRSSVYMGQWFNYILPKAIQVKIDKQFEKPESKGKKKQDEPAFDMIRAAVNLMVASILISIGTSLKLPLSTTYVTFMVAMGSSFADRAWDRESAVYRIAGVFNVIGGWFFTAIIAFVSAFIIAFLLKVGEVFAFVGLLVSLGIILYRSAKKYTKKEKEVQELLLLKREDIVTINEVINESSAQISRVIANTNKIYSDVIDNLGLQDLGKLKENKKSLKKLEKEVDELKTNVYYFIKNLDETSVEASMFYIMILGYLQDMIQSLVFISQNSYNHIDNNHKQLKFNQIRDLKRVDNELKTLFDKIEVIFNENTFDNLDNLVEGRKEILDLVATLIQKQIGRIRTVETSPKNSKLYFALLLETNDLIKATMSLLELFNEFNVHANSKVTKL
ncbi:inorganic phosphate transporter [Flavobacterium degerlachei]|jgi:phosphate/sulfate permease|uniref:Phosphate transporter n=1 Tax=Flavobacterium degerlachei TaxID=229203 RepID=A0A1H3DB19_9FLAO|nr:inorganic phosphate transporter [Flavobacterium degerlachei]SDX62924.1 Phosphate transporter family protein [Flavobacterium degerlachei]